jgi:antagonist of KipI
MTATINVLKAPPFLTVQDRGRPSGRIHGIPPSGAMDGWALSTANRLVGNPDDAAGLEWALAGGSIRFDQPAVFALTGATCVAALGDRPVDPSTTLHAKRGEVLAIERIVSGRFLYLAFHGGIDVPSMLGSRSTYLPGRFGGVEGRRLKTGDIVKLGPPSRSVPLQGFTIPGPVRIRYDESELRVVEGPQKALFGEEGWRAFLAGQYAVSPASDRMGYRLTGPMISSSAAPDIPSEPACLGSIQIPSGGTPIVLLADGPTVGGYPKIAVVITADLPILVQRSPGEQVRFRAVPVAEAQRLYREGVLPRP